jgi:homoserine dehydrogenase
MKSRECINIGFIGFGTVGSGAVRLLHEHREEIRRRVDIEIRIKAICSPSIFSRDTSWVDHRIERTTNVQSIIDDPEIDLIIETIGGLDPAHSIILQAIERNKFVVTANKLLLAAAGPELIDAATARGVGLGIEAAVAGGIPVLNAIREGLTGERFEHCQAILNGTCNYILTEMEKRNRPFNEVLSEAQQLGYAESDPTLDIEGYDARDKLAILAMLCFGVRVEPDKIKTIGISRLQPVDLVYAHNIGYTIRLICKAQRFPNGELALRVSPTLVRRDSMIGRVEGSFNAVILKGLAGDISMYYGRGAGSGPTGVAIVSDIVRAARELKAGVASLSPAFNYLELKPLSLASPSMLSSPYFIRFLVNDRPGIIAQLAEIFSRYKINIDSVMQEKPYEDRHRMPFVITLESSTSDRLEKALEEIGKLDYLTEQPLAMPIEEN